MSLRLTAGRTVYAPSKVLRRSEHGLHMPRDPHFAPDFADDALAIHQKGGPLHAHVFPSVQRLLAPDAVGLGREGFRVRGQYMLQLVLGLELVMARRAVLGHPDNRDAQRLELLAAFGETDRLLGAARRVVLGI